MLGWKKTEIIFFASWSENACSDSGLMHVVSWAKVNLFEVFHQHVNCIWCLHVWDTHQLARRFRRPADHSPLLFPPPPYRHLPRTRWPPSAWDVSNTASGVMSAQQLEPVNDSRWMLVPWTGWGGWEELSAAAVAVRERPSRRAVRMVSTGQHALWRVIEVKLQAWDASMSWWKREARVATYRGKMHGRKSVQGLAMARCEFGELMGGELTRFDCIYIIKNFCVHSSLYLLVSWAWWDWPSMWLTNHRLSMLWHCWLGHLTHKIVSEMTYNVSNGMLNHTRPYHTFLLIIHFMF